MVLNYIGSKKTLLNYIYYVIDKNIEIKKDFIFPKRAFRLLAQRLISALSSFLDESV